MSLKINFEADWGAKHPPWNQFQG